MPRAAMSVATRTRTLPVLNAASAPCALGLGPVAVDPLGRHARGSRATRPDRLARCLVRVKTSALLDLGRAQELDQQARIFRSEATG